MSISYYAENFVIIYLDHGLQCTKVRKFNFALYGTLFIVIAYQLNDLHNFSLFEISLTVSCISGQSAIYT